MSQFLVSSGQSIGASASALLLPMNIQDWFPLEFIGWISLQSKGQAKVFSNTTVQKHWFFISLPSLWTISPPYTTAGNTKLLTIRTVVGKVMSLLFNMLSRLVRAFLPRSKSYLISWLQSLCAVSDFGVPPNKVCHCFHCFPIYLPWSNGTRCHDLSFLNVEL